MLAERKHLYCGFFPELLQKWKCQVAQRRSPCSEFLMENRVKVSDDPSGQQAVMGPWTPVQCACIKWHLWVKLLSEAMQLVDSWLFFFMFLFGLHVSWQPFHFGVVASTLLKQFAGTTVLHNPELRGLVIKLQFYFVTLLSCWWSTSSLFMEFFWRPSCNIAFINCIIGVLINPNHKWGMNILMSEIGVPNSDMLSFHLNTMVLSYKSSTQTFHYMPFKMYRKVMSKDFGVIWTLFIHSSNWCAIFPTIVYRKEQHSLSFSRVCWKTVFVA